MFLEKKDSLHGRHGRGQAPLALKKDRVGTPFLRLILSPSASCFVGSFCSVGRRGRAARQAEERKENRGIPPLDPPAAVFLL